LVNSNSEWSEDKREEFEGKTAVSGASPLTWGMSLKYW
jgi:hypothetical protein